MVGRSLSNVGHGRATVVFDDARGGMGAMLFQEGVYLALEVGLVGGR